MQKLCLHTRRDWPNGWITLINDPFDIISREVVEPRHRCHTYLLQCLDH